MDTRKAQKVLRVVGAEQFRQSDVAEEALEIATEELEPGQDLIRVSFEIFMELLDDYGKLRNAFTAGIERIPMRYLLTKLPPQDADDVGQVVAMATWKSFRNFVALQPGSWDAWLMMITKRKLNTHLAEMYAQGEWFVRFRQHDAEWSQIKRGQGFPPVKIDLRGWSVPGICTEWIETVPEDEKAAFAAQIMAMYQGQSGWIGPTGTRMCMLVGLDKSAGSRSKIYRWWKEFVEEVHRREG